VLTVLPTPTLISLSAILQSLAPDSLSARLSSFRRDLITKFLDASLLSLRPITLSESDPSSLSLSLSSTSSSPFQSLQTLLSFLNSHFFPHLPPAQASFPTTLHGPITSAILTHFLEPSIPSSLSALPSFLGVIDEAVHFEERLLSGESRDRPIRHWVADVAGHYEKKRRESFLRLTREELSRPEDGSTFKIEDAFKQPPKHVNDSAIEEVNPDAWGFDEEVVRKPHSISSPDTGQDKNGHHRSTPGVQDHGGSPRAEEDASDGWGWGDDADDEADETGLQDEHPSEVQESDVDPWDDDGWSDPMPPPQEPELTRESALSAAPKAVQKGTPKLATRLEKFSAKAKGHGVTNASTSVSPVVSQVAHPPPPSPSPPKIAPSRPPQIKSQESPAEQEWYLVSSRAKKVLEIVENAMQEGQELSNSKYVPSCADVDIILTRH
jgi:protein transport protein DSL1/ZW10